MPYRTPPRFVIRTLVATLATVAFVLSAVLLVVTLNVRTSVRDGVVKRLETGQQLLGELEKRRAEELLAQVAMLAENSTLKAAVDTYQSELRTTNPAGRQDLVATIARELDKLAARIQPDVLEVRSLSGEVLGIAGRRAAEWPAYARLTAPTSGNRCELRDNADGRLSSRLGTGRAAGNRTRDADPGERTRRALRRTRSPGFRTRRR